MLSLERALLQEAIKLQETKTQLTPESKAVGKPCAHCSELLQPQDWVVECPRCHAFHHADCWMRKGGCSRTGCPQVAKAVVGEKPSGDGPPPPVDRRYVIGGIAAFVLALLAMVFWPQPPHPAGDRQRVVFMTEASVMEQDQLEALANRFHEEQEELYLDLQLLPHGNMEMKLIVQIGAGDAPDIFTLPAERFDYFVQQRALLNVGSEEEPVWGVRHPGQARYIVVFGQTEDPEAARSTLDFLLENLPAADDPEALWERDSGGMMPMPANPFGL